MSCGYNLPFKFTSILHFWPALEDELLDSIGLGLLLPFGLRYGPGMLSKVLKPVVAFLRVSWGILIAFYMDDILIQGFSPFQVCLHAFFPKQWTSHLGFILVSVSMTVSCPPDKITWENFDSHLHG